MKKYNTLLILLCFIVSFAHAQTEKIVDLTHSFDENTLYFPVGQPFQLHKLHAGITPNHYYVAENAFDSSEHTGTHMDAPSHFAKNHPSVDQISLNKLTGPAIKIDVTSKTVNRDYQITIDDLLTWEKHHGQIPDQSIVLLQTGFSQFWPSRKKYLGTGNLGMSAVKDLHFPGLDPQATHWLIEKRHIKAIGIDTGSIDYGQTQNFPSHKLLTQHNIPIFENITNLEAIPNKNFYVYALPMKITHGTGAPLRIIAVTRDN